MFRIETSIYKVQNLQISQCRCNGPIKIVYYYLNFMTDRQCVTVNIQ